MTGREMVTQPTFGVECRPDCRLRLMSIGVLAVSWLDGIVDYLLFKIAAVRMVLEELVDALWPVEADDLFWP